MELYRQLYIVQSKNGNVWQDEEFFPEDNRTMEEIKKDAINCKNKLADTLIDEKFRVILFKEYILFKIFNTIKIITRTIKLKEC